MVTPADYRAGERYVLILSGPYTSGRRAVIANRKGQLTIQVPLGPANPYQEYTAQAEALGTASSTARPALPLAPVGDDSALPVDASVSGTGNALQAGPAVSETGQDSSQSGPAVSDSLAA